MPDKRQGVVKQQYKVAGRMDEEVMSMR